MSFLSFAVIYGLKPAIVAVSLSKWFFWHFSRTSRQKELRLAGLKAIGHEKN
jgi:hypothetical protein